MRSLVFLALSVIISYAANGAKPSNLSHNQAPLPTDGKKPPAVCNCNLTVNQVSQVSGAVKNLEMKLDKLLAQKLKTKLETISLLINKTATTEFETTSLNATETCNQSLKKLETKVEKLLAQNLETKLETLTALVSKTTTRGTVTTSLNTRCDDALKKVETKLGTISAMINKALLSVLSSASSCKELYDVHKVKTSRVYPLKFGSQGIHVYCHMGDFGCGDGGWTLAMKIDGTKRTFHYDSHFWSDKNPYNFAGGRTGFDSQETKLPTYWNTAFSKICLGMKIGHKIRFITIHRHANSLYSLIADGQYRVTSLGRNTWKKLIGPQASLQTYCNKEGFNAKCSENPDFKARLGIISNEHNYCRSCDSRIGFGTGGRHDDRNTCGNEATYSPDNGNKHIKTMGYILVY